MGFKPGSGVRLLMRGYKRLHMDNDISPGKARHHYVDNKLSHIATSYQDSASAPTTKLPHPCPYTGTIEIHIAGCFVDTQRDLNI